MEPEEGIWFEIKGRSSTFRHYNVIVLDAIIDNGYRGEMFVQVYNPLDKIVKIPQGSRIAQVIPHLLVPVKFVYKYELSGSKRSNQGFGSTGR